MRVSSIDAESATNPYVKDTNPSDTIGMFSDEPAAWAAFDALVEKTGMFKIQIEVPGKILQPRLLADEQDTRIDRIIFPNQQLVDAGWKFGPIGVEIKKSRTKLGPPLSQILDYSRCVWDIHKDRSTWATLFYFFLFPAAKMHGPIASILAQNRIGTCESSHWYPLEFWSGESRILSFDQNQIHSIGRCDAGKKTGSR
jgi:hypothetical protein